MSDVVCNASPLIVLAKAGQLNLLPGPFGRVIIPMAVREEILAGAAEDPMRQALPECPWLVRPLSSKRSVIESCRPLHQQCRR